MAKKASKKVKRVAPKLKKKHNKFTWLGFGVIGVALAIIVGGFVNSLQKPGVLALSIGPGGGGGTPPAIRYLRFSSVPRCITTTYKGRKLTHFSGAITWSEIGIPANEQVIKRLLYVRFPSGAIRYVSNSTIVSRANNAFGFSIPNESGFSGSQLYAKIEYIIHNRIYASEYVWYRLPKCATENKSG